MSAARDKRGPQANSGPNGPANILNAKRRKKGQFNFDLVERVFHGPSALDLGEEAFTTEFAFGIVIEGLVTRPGNHALSGLVGFGYDTDYSSQVSPKTMLVTSWARPQSKDQFFEDHNDGCQVYGTKLAELLSSGDEPLFVAHVFPIEHAKFVPRAEKSADSGYCFVMQGVPMYLKYTKVAELEETDRYFPRYKYTFSLGDFVHGGGPKNWIPSEQTPLIVAEFSDPKSTFKAWSKNWSKQVYSSKRMILWKDAEAHRDPAKPNEVVVKRIGPVFGAGEDNTLFDPYQVIEEDGTKGDNVEDRYWVFFSPCV